MEPSIAFGDFLILKFCPVCVSSPLPFEWFALWVVCEQPALAFCERWGVVFYNPIIFITVHVFLDFQSERWTWHVRST